MRDHAPLAAIYRLADAPDGVVEPEEAGALGVAEEVVGANDEAFVAAPVVGIAHGNFEGAKFAESFDLGFRGHPGDVFEALVERCDEVGDHGLGLGFGFGGEVLLDVELADGVAERLVDELDGSPVAGTLLRRAGERGAEEGEGFVGDGLGQGGGAGFEGVEGQPVFPRVERCGGCEGGLAFEGGRLPDVEGLLRGEPGGAEILGPVEAGCLGGKVGGGPEIVGAVDVFVVGERDLLGGDGLFEGEDVLGALFGVVETSEAEHRRHVGGVLGEDVLHVRRVGEVVIAAGEEIAALEEIGGVVIGIVEAGSDPETEQIGSVIVGVVEGVDIGAKSEAESVGELRSRLDGGDAVELGLDGGEAALVDGGRVHERGVEVGDAASIGVRGSVGFGCIGDDAGDLLVGAVGHEVEGAERGAVGGQLCAGDPGAVGVEEEVVPGLDGVVDARNVDAVGLVLRKG